jgi:hypothetical protein
MGILAPLFLAGLAGLAIPLVLHLVRRTPRGQQQFSSLMFLTPTPPRLTRRSRLDQVLLLLMRLAVLTLLAFAFARPFLRESALLSLADLEQRRVAILLDTSASMRRGNLWQQALEVAQRELDELAPQDEVALYTFDDRVRTVVSFTRPNEPSAVPPVEIVRQALQELEPSWAAGDLGSAVTSLAGELEATTDVAQSTAKPQIIVISDFQQGSRVEALQGYEWPQDVRVVSRQLSLRQTSNATLQLLPPDAEDEEGVPRVRVVNAADSTQEQFHVRWYDAKNPQSTAGEVAVYVPPGQSRVVRLPRPMNNLLSDRVVLRGDAYDYDNTFYVVPPRQQQVLLVYLGGDSANDPQGLQYYLRLATEDDPLRQVEIKPLPVDASLPADPSPQLVVATQKLSAAQTSDLKNYVERGGALILIATDRESAATFPAFIPTVELQPEKPNRREDEYALLGEINFTHPLFQPFSNPRYNDFTRIHFWQHHPVTAKAESETRVLARFDNGDPWLLEQSLGKGRVWAFTSGWRPDDSQLAVSSKFLPLIGGLLDLACGSTKSFGSTIVNAPVALPEHREQSLVIHTPSNKQHVVAPTEGTFRETSEPGIYHSSVGKDEFRFAVNLSPSESDTAPLPLEQLEQLGLKFGQSLTKAERLSRERQERDTELEARQQVWRWLMIGCLIVVILETCWAARASRLAHSATEAAV